MNLKIGENSKLMGKILDEKVIFCAGPWLEVSRQNIIISDERLIKDYYKINQPSYPSITEVEPVEKVFCNYRCSHRARRNTLTLPG